MLSHKRILIIAPHPDDEAICNGGLIMLAKKQQAEVFVLYGAIGTSRQLVTGETTANVRIPELQAAAAFGTFNHKIMFEGDEFMRMDTVPQKSLIEKIEDTVKTFKPNIVCIPNRSSFDQDHRELAVACVTALRPLPASLHPQPDLILESEEPSSWSTQAETTPNFFVDITEVIDEKMELLKCHKTQLREDPFPRSIENLKRLAGLRGCEIGVPFAEAYTLLKGKLV